MLYPPVAIDRRNGWVCNILLLSIASSENHTDRRGLRHLVRCRHRPHRAGRLGVFWAVSGRSRHHWVATHHRGRCRPQSLFQNGFPLTHIWTPRLLQDKLSLN